MGSKGTAGQKTTLPETNILLMAEILHQLLGSLSDYLQGFIHPRWVFGISSINIFAPETWMGLEDFLVSFWGPVYFQGRCHVSC